MQQPARRALSTEPEEPIPTIPDFLWLQWGFRDAEDVASYCIPSAQRTVDAMRRIPFSTVEEQLDARGFTVGEFKEGATLAYRQVRPPPLTLHDSL